MNGIPVHGDGRGVGMRCSPKFLPTQNHSMISWMLFISKIQDLVIDQGVLSRLGKMMQPEGGFNLRAYLRMHQVCVCRQIIPFDSVFKLWTAEIRERSAIFRWRFSNKNKQKNTLRKFCFLLWCPSDLQQNWAAKSVLHLTASPCIQPWFCIKMPAHLQEQLE